MESIPAETLDKDEAVRKKASMANMCYDKSKSGPKHDQLVLLKVKTKVKRKDFVNDVQMQDATKDDNNE
eukprot:12196659-Karenia_brevis.AAC.1